MTGPGRKFGLIGYPLGHSWSKGYFMAKFAQAGPEGCSYENFEIPSASLLREIVDGNPDLAGLNVTIPYKQAVLEFLDYIDPVAAEIGAVNTIVISRSGGRIRLSGYNTDVTGFTNSLMQKMPVHGTRALVFGMGGSSLAVKFALKVLDIIYISVSRKAGPYSIDYTGVTDDIAASHKVWINCTPVGMFPHSDEKLPLPYHCLTPEHLLYDLVYNPEVTEYLKMGLSAGANTMNGSVMLYEQAEAAWKIWNASPV